MTAFYLQESTIDGWWTYKLTSPQLDGSTKGCLYETSIAGLSKPDHDGPSN